MKERKSLHREIDNINLTISFSRNTREIQTSLSKYVNLLTDNTRKIHYTTWVKDKHDFKKRLPGWIKTFKEMLKLEGDNYED